MNAAAIAAIAGPLIGAALLITWPAGDRDADGAWARAADWVVAGALGAALGGAIFCFVRVLQGADLRSTGLEIDAWRALVAVGAIAVAGAGMIARVRDARRDALTLAALAAGIVTIFAADGAVFAGFLIVTTAAVAALTLDAEDARASDAVAVLAGSDLAAVLGLVMLSSERIHLPPVARGVGAAALVVAAALRLGLIPGSRSVESIARGRSGSLLHGVVRAQGFVLAGWVALRGSDAATVMAIGAAYCAAERARRAVRDGSIDAALTAHAALVVAGLGIRTPAAVAGAVLLVAGSFLGATLAHLGRRSDAVPSFGAAPLGATLAGAALVAQAALARTHSDRSALAVAIPAAAALIWLAMAGVGGMQQRRARAPLAFSLPVLGAVAGFVIFPDVVLRHGAVAVARALGAAPTLRPIDGAISGNLGPVFAVAALAAVLSQTARAAPQLRVHDIPPERSEAMMVPMLGIALEVAAVGWWALLLGIAIQRGFL